MKRLLVVVAGLAIVLLTAGCGSSLISQTPSEKPAMVGTTPASPSEKAIEGVVSIGPKLSPQEVATKIAKGKTTLDEVMSLLGPPDNISMQPDSGRTVTYSWRKELEADSLEPGKVIGDAALHATPFGIFRDIAKLKAAKAQMAAVKNSHRSLTMVFDPNGVLKDLQFSPPLPATPLAVNNSPSLAAVNPTR